MPGNQIKQIEEDVIEQNGVAAKSEWHERSQVRDRRKNHYQAICYADEGRCGRGKVAERRSA